jgi:hypothetical protein
LKEASAVCSKDRDLEILKAIELHQAPFDDGRI